MRKIYNRCWYSTSNCLSPILFTFYLANSLKENDDKNYVSDHEYAERNQTELTIDQQFADDTNWISNSAQTLNKIKSETSEKLIKRNLKIDNDKQNNIV